VYLFSLLLLRTLCAWQVPKKCFVSIKLSAGFIILELFTNVFILVLGDPRTNQNPAILAIGVVFFRFHNVVAGRIQEEHPEWSDEEVFQRARRVVVATLQVRLNLRKMEPFKAFVVIFLFLYYL
jgi:hypothetical protein